MKIQQQKTALKTSSLCCLNLASGPFVFHVKKVVYAITLLCVRLTIYPFIPLLANLHIYACNIVKRKNVTMCVVL